MKFASLTLLLATQTEAVHVSSMTKSASKVAGTSYCAGSMYPNQGDCWSATAYQKCPDNRQGAYNLINKAGGSTAAAKAKYDKLMKFGVVDNTPCHGNGPCQGAMYLSQDDCWAATAYQQCAMNRQGAYDFVNSKGGSTPAAKSAFETLMRNGQDQGVSCTVQAHPPSPANSTAVRDEERNAEQNPGSNPSVTVELEFQSSMNGTFAVVDMNDGGDNNQGGNHDGLRGCERVCENHGFSKNQCNSMKGCHFDDGQCWSAVGPNECPK